MAINTFTASSDKIPLLQLNSMNSSKGSITSSQLVNTNFGTDSSVTSSNKSKRRSNGKSSSPYLNNEKVHLLSRVTEKRVVQKKAAEFTSSFPLAVNIYKANSDEFKSIKKNKRAKKSVLTLPNEQAPAPQTCTVSDMNDSEELNNNDDNRKKRPKKRPTAPNRRSRNDFEFYDRDARYCSQFNIHLDCSSTDVIRNVKDVNKNSNRKKQYMPTKAKVEGNFNGHDVWRVLRNINRFQFRPSPPMSEEDIPLPRKKGNKMRFNRKDTRFIETCRTEEIAYISSIEVDSKSPTFSHSSSFDRVTVIDKKDEFTRICEEFEQKIGKSQNVTKNVKNQKNNKNKKSVTKKTLKACNKGPGTKEITQGINPSVKELGFKHSYENNVTGTMSTYSSSNANEDSLTLNAHIDIGQRNRNLSNSIQKNQMHILMDPSDTMISSVNTFSSKTAGQEISKGPNKVFKASEGTPNLPITGITKVVLSKGQDIVLSRRMETPKRRSRLPTTLTTATILPKLTQTDIRRRLLNMKFPIVILGKDQVSSTIQVMDYDPPQFDGLDNQIWPFMIEWSDDKSKLKMELGSISSSKEMIRIDQNNSQNTVLQKKKFHHIHGDHKFNNMKFDTADCKQPSKREPKLLSDNKTNKRDRIPVVLPIDIKEKQQPRKPKPIRQLKDKVLKLLYKKPRDVDEIEEDIKLVRKCDVKYEPKGCVTNIMDLSVNKKTSKANTVDDSTTVRNLNTVNSRVINTNPITIKRQWAKAKWASEFIETVIKKIRNGVYYNQDNKYEHGKLFIDAKEVSVQTRSSLENTNKGSETETTQTSDQLVAKSNKILHALPGFDDSLPELKVKTLGTNKIEIKNISTNIIVQFDITVPTETDKLGLNLKKSCSLIPLEKTESNTKFFKCKATILNAMLPAELCSILPNMMREILHPDNTKLSHALPINKTDSQLSTISESSHYEGFDCFKSISKLSTLSPKVNRMLSGRFAHAVKKQKTLHRVKSIAYNALEIESVMLPTIPASLMPLVVEPIENIICIKYRNIAQQTKNNIYDEGNNVCQTLEQYNSKSHALIPAGQSYNIMNIFKDIWTSYLKNGPFKFSIHMPACTISLHIRDGNTSASNAVVDIGNIKVYSIFENSAKVKNEYNSKRLLKKIDYSSPVHLRGPEALDSVTISEKKINQNHSSNHKVKRKGFVRLYKKCKSTSNIPNEKSSLPLNKIINLDDFCQLLGSKSLCCIFDGNSGKKILSSVTTMKNWITDINSRQAILVLLLANKKDTPNLIRLRPILLQGIAVNRITRASELDMEIEVIERENLNIVSQFEGIFYVPASTENKDSLLEELYWIAKTTASDYQKPFDETSEKLLKSLLEKRKKLNPSYLRVMARYVGLGLLKSPSKK